ncbi:MAG: extracellular solute-binding protein [Pseudonocardia sp.]
MRGDVAKRRWRKIWSSAAVSAVAVTLLAGMLTACGGQPADLTIYSGRNQQLVGELLEQLKREVGGTVEVRYGTSSELAAQLLEEGERTQADVFFSQDAGALGELTAQGRLERLPDDVLNIVPAQYRAGDGNWVATSARVRVVAYDPRQVSAADLPTKLDDLVDPKWKGRIGYPPTNPSWQSFVTAVRVLRGEDGARDWLTKFKANEPVRFANNVEALAAVDRGQIALGLINHYYWFEKVAEVGAAAVTAKLHYVGNGDPLDLVNVAGVGVIKGSPKADLARRAAAFLVSQSAQQYFVDVTAEYPVRAGITSTKHQLPPLSSLQPPPIDLSKLASLKETLALLQETGLG